MREGDVLGDRFLLESRLDASPGHVRFLGRDQRDGTVVELRAVDADPAARERFARHWRGVARGESGSVIAVIEVSSDGWVAHAPTIATASELPRPLDPALVAAIGVALLPAGRRREAVLRGALLPVDVCIDAEGAPRLAPAPRSGGDLAPQHLRYIAPEAFAGSERGESALFGLGVLLFELATGTSPFPVPPPPGERATAPRASAVRPGVPPALDTALALLLHADPSRRFEAATALAEAAGALRDLRPELARARTQAGSRPLQAATAATGELVVSARRGGPGGLSVRATDPGAFVVIPARAARALDSEALAAAAGTAGLSLDAVLDLVEAELPVPLSGHAGAGRATTAAAALSLPAEVVAGARPLPALAAIAGFGAAGLVALVGAATVVVGLVPIGVALLGLAAVLAVVGALGTVSIARNRRELGRAREAWRRTEPERKQRAGGALADTWGRIDGLRARIAKADLPVAIAVDLRGALRDLEERVQGLGAVHRVADDTLAAVDPARVRAELAAASRAPAADTAAATRRDRLARTLADLEAVAATLAALDRELAEMHDGIDEVHAALAQLTTGTDADSAGGAVERLRRTARLATAPIDEAELRARAARALGTDAP